MKFRLFQRRSIWWPTLPGWACLLLAALAATAFWWIEAETFLSTTRRQPAEVLVVESWIGFEGLKAAKAEFEHGGYRYLVSAGGLSSNPWDRQRWNLANEAADEFVRLGFPKDKIIVASQKDSERQRTFETAVAAWRALHAAHIHPQAINVFTEGAHARRSRLIFSKVFRPDAEVGVVSWRPSEYRDEPWWRSSERAEDLIKETVGYVFEVLLNSGRMSNTPADVPAQKSGARP